MSNEKQEIELEVEAAVEFAREVALASPKKRVDRTEARKLAGAAASVAREFLAEPPPKLADPVVPVEAAPAPADTASCACGVELGHAVYGVHTNGRWYCPSCYMREARNHDNHPVARAVECPTCHRKSVDFTGRNQCPVCRARGARPMRVN